MVTDEKAEFRSVHVKFKEEEKYPTGGIHHQGQKYRTSSESKSHTIHMGVTHLQIIVETPKKMSNLNSFQDDYHVLRIGFQVYFSIYLVCALILTVLKFARTYFSEWLINPLRFFPEPLIHFSILCVCLCARARAHRCASGAVIETGPEGSKITVISQGKTRRCEYLPTAQSYLASSEFWVHILLFKTCKSFIYFSSILEFHSAQKNF